MRNDILFLNIHEGEQASEKYGKPDEYKPGKQHYGDVNRQKVLKKAYTGWGHNTENLTSTSLENNITATSTGRKCSWKPTLDEVTIRKTWRAQAWKTTLRRRQQVESAHESLHWMRSQYGKSDEYKPGKQHHRDANRQQMLMKAYTEWRWRVNEFTNLFLQDIFAKYPCRKQLPFATPMLFAVRFLCFRSFPEAPLQLRTPARIKNNFPGLCCGNPRSLWPRTTIFRPKSWPERHPELRRTTAWRMQIQNWTWKNNGKN